ncbi:Vps45p NDAI_0F02220 [Naumovozyma dairenensis CBS 421]|uniref:Vacuolar protein sorting-associated protein 45 n=1 Tax=Naumovozyma dairenensis (strain ATCC 10597 / BCRC 20456 / CBS 421 / NBRC 0211 / NRRL Y-12639) TaxID=1071378 RepID=G0WCM9_NAUDC|nr:hypothetical protein NDAI_0F02220 [Naumovozyma dairenensis CBS 421]CCD25540.1 hypothetical protein NDAI_0F02220 [Naumovozyma dairenensis CBS 421]
MNLFDVADVYIKRIVNSTIKPSHEGLTTTMTSPMIGAGAMYGNTSSRIKALLLDKDTISTISMCATQSELLKNEIFLIDTIENKNRDVMRHLKCLVYIKPVEESIQCLIDELNNPKYGEYHVFFNNLISKSQLERLAEADNLEVVVKVEEIFQDYQILNEDLFSFEMTLGSSFHDNRKLFRGDDLSIWDPTSLKNCSNSLISVLLSLKLRPEIKFDSHSKLCSKLAHEINNEINKNDKNLFDFPKMDVPPILLILDRKMDPMTALLQPWTYRSMINEYIGIKRNIVDLSSVPNIDKELLKVTLTSKQDPFYHDSMYLNFGELGDKIKIYVNDYKKITKSNSKIETIDDIKQFIEKFPEFKKISGNVSKHMAIISELDRQLKIKDIWDISEIEQNLSVFKDDDEDYKKLTEKILINPDIDFFYKVKLCCIYYLRYCHDGSNEPRINAIINKLKTQGISLDELSIFENFRKQINFVNKRENEMEQSNDINGDITNVSNNNSKDTTMTHDLLSDILKKFNSKMESAKNMQKNRNRNAGNTNNTNEDNVYLQHIPELSHLLSDLSMGQLSETRYKTLTTRSGNVARNKKNNQPVQDVVVFVVGGTTFEEARFVHQFNDTMKGKIRIILGGTSILSTKDYLNSFS